ncbi:hypothetical protein like AT2G02650 [Hibiscus trionum]|uniref:Reverse transcriptase zinc-binding domain n=1 Tax=Hibiscus trionum TaxID=183268 RepID=A0A9W7JG41_HIBTR|nr:hypothetical protein like AT2G02650 [Hibiscus trionum]
MWKTCHNIVPSKHVLKRRLHGKGHNDDLCPRCCEESESLEHILFFCPFGQAIWRASDFSYSPSSIGFPGMFKWWQKLPSLNKNGNLSEGLYLISFLCWTFWKSRNRLVFSDMVDSPIKVWLKAQEAFSEFSSFLTNKPEISPCTRRETSQWTPPNPGFLKVNCDASFDPNIGVDSGDVIFRDETRSFINGKLFSFSSRNASCAEALALRFVITSDVDSSFSHVVFESDNLGVIGRINSKTLSAWESAAIEQDILCIATPFPFFSFKFVNMLCNKAVDWVAKATRLGTCPNNWASCIPQELRVLL